MLRDDCTGEFRSSRVNVVLGFVVSCPFRVRLAVSRGLFIDSLVFPLGTRWDVDALVLTLFSARPCGPSNAMGAVQGGV